jgi:hypothetical protein
MVLDAATLQAALVGYQAERDRIKAAIADLEQRLGKKGDGRRRAGAASTEKAAKRNRSRMSAEGRARIAEAQRKRWATLKKGNAL